MWVWRILSLCLNPGMESFARYEFAGVFADVKLLSKGSFFL